MSNTNGMLASNLYYRARKTGVTGPASRTKRGIKKLLNRAERVAAKEELQQELTALAAIPTHDALLDICDLSRVCYSSAELEAMADTLLADAELDIEGADDGTLDLGVDRELPLELQGGLPDWMLDNLNAANGDAFSYLSLLEKKRPRSMSGMLVEELHDAD